MKLHELCDIINERAPFNIQEDWDNSGMNIGSMNSEITSVVCCLDVTLEVVEYAIKCGANTIVSHHPLIFKGLTQIDYETEKGEVIRRIISQSINHIAVHTNFDLIGDGVSHLTAKKLGFEKCEILLPTSESYGYGVLCDCALSFDELVSTVKSKLGSAVVWGELKNVNSVAVIGGAGGSMIGELPTGKVDVLITGDVKYHDAQLANENGIAVIDVGHFESEHAVIFEFARIIEERLGIKAYIYDKPAVKRFLI